MRIESVQAIDGPNIHSHRPVVIMRVDLGDYAETETTQLGDAFIDRLLNHLPGLREHCCSLGKPGGFVKRLKQGTYLGHVIEHAALELQALAGIGTVYGKTRYAGRRGVYNVIFEYQAKQAAIYAARAAFRLVNSLLKSHDFPVAEEVQKIREIAAETELGPSTRAICEAARKRGIPVMRLGQNSLVQLGYGAAAERIEATITSRTSCIAVDVACDKAFTKQLLDEAGFPIPYGKIFTDEDKAVQFALDLNGAAVIKPRAGNQGKGVSLNLSTEDEIRAAFRVAKQYGEEIIVERYISGQHYRLTVVNNEMVAAALRIPAHVIGDGRHTIRELIDIVNQDPNRGKKHEKPLTRITIDPVVELVLKQQGLTLDDIPARNHCIYLRKNANLSTGGIAYDVTEQVHPDNRWVAIRAAQVVGLDVAGVDIVLPDIGKSYTEQSGAIIEVNAAPGIRMHHYPVKGQPRDVAGAIVDYLFPEGRNGRIPLVSITGTNGKTTTARLIARIMRERYARVGLTSTDGIFVNDACLLKGDTTGPISARTLLTHSNVDAAVLEIARGGLIRGGLAYDYSDAAVVTNIGDDHLGQDGIESIADLIHVKSLVVECVKPDGYAVLNADDASSRELAARARSRIIYFGCNSTSPVLRWHLAKGGKAVFSRDGFVYVAEGSSAEPLIKVGEIPITFAGRAKHNVENALAAIAAAWAVGLTSEHIIAGLKSFTPTLEHNPGRQNVIKMANGTTVVIDYAHNSDGFRSIIGLARQFKKGRLTGIICAPGDRLNQQIRELGKIAGEGFDRIFIKEDVDKRGRSTGEVAALLYEGAVSELAEEAVHIVSSEEQAIRDALSTAAQDEVIVILYEKLEDCLANLRKCCRDKAVVASGTEVAST